MEPTKQKSESGNEIMSFDGEAFLRGQEAIWQLMSGIVDFMALKCVVELEIADIINSHAAPITIAQIASGMNSPRLHVAYLARIMRYLSRKHIFTVQNPPSGEGEPLYGLNHNSKWLISDAEHSLTALVKFHVSSWMQHPLQYFGQCIKEGGIPFKKAHGVGMWDFASMNLEFNRLLNEGMACTAKIVMKAFFEGHNRGFNGIESVVDVGGGTGGLLEAIVKAHPHIKGINFDLPHVVATAPTYDKSHVGGNMFEAVPHADVVFMKWILHDWGDEDCIKILQNCRKAIINKTRGKLVLVEIVLQPDGTNHFEDVGLVLDLLMLAGTEGGKERTELEWKKLLSAGGFPRYNIIKIAAFLSIIEAFPE